MNIIEEVIKCFAEHEVEKLKLNKEIKGKKFNLEKMSKLKGRHYMKCPKCGMRLNEIEYKDGKIDKCTACDGVWLDAGELEVLLLNEKTVTENIYRTLIKEFY
jgi:hypothetical protein